jgi:hypothetical protein
VSLNGDYILKHGLGGDDRAAFFEAVHATDGARAIVKLAQDVEGKGNAALDLWHRARQLRHPNLIGLLGFGRTEHQGATAVYAVFEAPDDTLASALSSTRLNENEARDVLDSVMDALRYLHAQGLAHSAVDADHIVAVGDRVKLTTDTLREAAPSDCREDVRLLGELWQQALLPASSNSEELAAHAADPDPQSRWTLAEISAAIAPRVVAEPPPPPVTVSEPAPELPVIVREELPALPPPHRRVAEPASPYPFPKWIFAGVAGVLLLILALNWPRPARVATQPKYVPVLRNAPTPEPVPYTKPTPPTAAAPAVRKPPPTAGKETWRVIAFTYRTREAAANKAQQLNRYHPGLNAAVFVPKDKYYLVSLGGRMSHDEAVRLQRTARGKGLPRDLYVQNYSE